MTYKIDVENIILDCVYFNLDSDHDTCITEWTIARFDECPNKGTKLFNKTFEYGDMDKDMRFLPFRYTFLGDKIWS